MPEVTLPTITDDLIDLGKEDVTLGNSVQGSPGCSNVRVEEFYWENVMTHRNLGSGCMSQIRILHPHHIHADGMEASNE